MALLKVKCPECNAGLKSPTGFTVGQAVSCPKCETDFTVEEPEKAGSPADEDDDDAPVTKKKKKGNDDYDDDEKPTRSYKNSPARYAVLGVLVVIMLVLGYFLYEKKKKEREADAANNAARDGDGDGTPPPLLKGPEIGINPNPNPKGKGKGANPPPPPPPAPVKPKDPMPPIPMPKEANPKGPNIPIDPFGGLLGGGGVPDAKTALVLTEKYKTALAGTWTADLGDGATEELTYTATGTFTAKLTGPNGATANGKFTVLGLSGTKGLWLRLEAAGAPVRIVAVAFDGHELEHPSLQKGLVSTFKKK